MYTITFSDLALKQLKKLGRDLRIRIISTIERCRIRPYRYVKKLVDSPYFRLRVGAYRIVMDIKENKLMIFVIEIKHRKEIYKNL